MAHHEEEMSEELKRVLAEQLGMPVDSKKLMEDAAETLGLGPTGRFPEGKLTDKDEGEIRIAVTHHKGAVIINFGKPIASLGMTPVQARALITGLRKHIKAVQRGR